MILKSLILANLEEADFIRFHKAHIGYSSSTGPNANPAAYAFGRFIATSIDEFVPALDALKWKEFSMEATNEQLIISRKEK